MRRDSRVYLEDMLAAAEKIDAYVSGMAREDLKTDSKTLDAVVRNLEVIGEAAKNIPDATRQAHPEIAWRKMVGLRDILIHEYFGVDLEIVWDIVQHKLPELTEGLRRILQQQDG